MQATVATYDPQTRSGTAFADDGAEISFDRDAFDASGLRLLRLGQRIRVERDAQGEVRVLALITM